ncbi:MAG: biotin--[acetyl-CoA-carboxylase] ligase [Rickettsiales bacterium]|nr:biotin--[acetyl-CoA-carboxylase] ligase [Rickettsiales bacterium]
MKSWTYKNFTIHQFEELESTNKTAFELVAAKKIFDREIILADKQTAGKGRNSRVWHSPQGNLYFSLVLQPNISAQKIAQISFVAVTALRLAIQLLKPDLKIENKWPNDLLIDEKKIAGILLESKINQKNCELVIVGIGLNIVSNPGQTIFPASNLKKFGIEISCEKALKNFLNQFENLYKNYLDFGFVGIRKLWLEKSFCLNQEIKVKNNNQEISGIFSDLDEEGNLILKTSDGIKKISAADVYT